MLWNSCAIFYKSFFQSLASDFSCRFLKNLKLRQFSSNEMIEQMYQTIPKDLKVDQSFSATTSVRSELVRILSSNWTSNVYHGITDFCRVAFWSVVAYLWFKICYWGWYFYYIGFMTLGIVLYKCLHMCTFISVASIHQILTNIWDDFGFAWVLY